MFGETGWPSYSCEGTNVASSTLKTTCLKAWKVLWVSTFFSKIEDATLEDEHAIGVFVVFECVPLQKCCYVRRKHGVDETLIKWISALLTKGLLKRVLMIWWNLTTKKTVYKRSKFNGNGTIYNPYARKFSPASTVVVEDPQWILCLYNFEERAGSWIFYIQSSDWQHKRFAIATSEEYVNWLTTMRVLKSANTGPSLCASYWSMLRCVEVYTAPFIWLTVGASGMNFQ